MDNLLDITQKLQDTQAAITRLEDSLSRKTPTPSILATLNTLKRRHADLENELAEITSRQQLEVCRYRLFSDESDFIRPSLRAFTKTLFDFQNLFTQVYSAIKTKKPKNNTIVSVETSMESSFDFAYTFTGSLGVVLTLPNDRLLFGETQIDEAMSRIFTLMKAENPAEIALSARELGLAPIRTLYKWVSDQVESGLSAEIQWKRGNEVRLETLTQLPELERLKIAIESSSEEQVETYDLDGLLVGIDTTSRTFHMTFEQHGEMRGKIDASIGVDKPVQVPQRYRAKVVISTTISYATEKETVLYFLKELTPLNY